MRWSKIKREGTSEESFFLKDANSPGAKMQM